MKRFWNALKDTIVMLFFILGVVVTLLCFQYIMENYFNVKGWVVTLIVFTFFIIWLFIDNYNKPNQNESN